LEVRTSVATRVLLGLRLPQLDHKKIFNIPPEFGRDLVARGSSGLKPLRRRAPRQDRLDK